MEDCDIGTHWDALGGRHWDTFGRIGTHWEALGPTETLQRDRETQRDTEGAASTGTKGQREMDTGRWNPVFVVLKYVWVGQGCCYRDPKATFSRQSR
eukprot:1240163-Rhodomonas_salina.1